MMLAAGVQLGACVKARFAVATACRVYRVERGARQAKFCAARVRTPIFSSGRDAANVLAV